MMVEDSHVETRIIEYRKRGVDTGITGRGAGELLAVALTDVLSDGLSMVYSFFEPSQQSRSLGTFMILDHIDARAQAGLPYVYLGYWIEGSKQDGLQGPLPAAAAAGAVRLAAGRRDGRNAVRAAGLRRRSSGSDSRRAESAARSDSHGIPTPSGL